ncbi:MAG: hypothetical protein JHD33_08025 [Chthoniobacterales bacterium]|nr:hypothetical protein [Chthoniobacterales bacterium]
MRLRKRPNDQNNIRRVAALPQSRAKLEPVVLAALISGDPLLLIGKHGTAKSFLLERLAEALGLAFRF